MTDKLIENDSTPNEEVVILGKYKLPGVIGFSSLSGNYKINTDDAFINGKHFSGMMDHLTFKLIVRSNETVDFDEVDTNETDEATRGRLLERFIDSEPVMGKLGGMYDPSLFHFTSTTESKITKKTVQLILLTKMRAPIDLLGDICVSDTDISESGITDLNDWLNEIGVVVPKKEPIIKEEVEVVVDQDNSPLVTKDSDANKYKVSKEEGVELGIILKDELGASILHSNEVVVTELKRKIATKERDITTFKSKILSTESEIEELQGRVDEIENVFISNNLLFSVSEEIETTEAEFSDDVLNSIKNKIEKVKSINTDAFMDLFKIGKYIIKIGDSNGDIFSGDVNSLTLPNNVTFKDGEFIYVGDKMWHDLVKEMIFLGYSQDATFDEKVGSNSYGVKGESILPNNTTVPIDLKINGDNEVGEIKSNKLENFFTKLWNKMFTK